jgi:serine/threonine-protein kinase
MGTPLYMSPEQVQAKPLDPRTDIYSLGVTAYQMLAGEPPFKGANAFDVAIQHVQQEPIPLGNLRPDLPPDLCRLVHKMMAKAPVDRYPCARDLIADLARIRDGLPVSATAVGLPTVATASASEPKTQSLKPEKPSQGLWTAKKLRRLGIASVILSLLGGMALGWYHGRTGKSNLDDGEIRGDSSALEALMTPMQKEDLLKKGFQPYREPGKDEDKIRTGLELCRDLGVLYLDQGKWKDADAFFLDLTSKYAGKVEPYASFGKIGHAIALGLENHPKESNQMFQELLPKELPGRNSKPPSKPALDYAAFILRHAKLRQWIAEALEYNHKNDPKDFPPNLEIWRRAAKK